MKFRNKLPKWRHHPLKSDRAPLIPLEGIGKCIDLMDPNHEMHSNQSFKLEGIFEFMSQQFKLQKHLKLDNTKVLKGHNSRKGLVVGKSDHSIVIAFCDNEP